MISIRCTSEVIYSNLFKRYECRKLRRYSYNWSGKIKSSSNSLAGSAIFPFFSGMDRRVSRFIFMRVAPVGVINAPPRVGASPLEKLPLTFSRPRFGCFQLTRRKPSLGRLPNTRKPTLNVSMMKTSPRETISLFPPSINYRETSLSKLVSLARIKKRAKGRVRCERGPPLLSFASPTPRYKNRDKIVLYIYFYDNWFRKIRKLSLNLSLFRV